LIEKKGTFKMENDNLNDLPKTTVNKILAGVVIIIFKKRVKKFYSN
jgi:histone H3/H4